MSSLSEVIEFIKRSHHLPEAMAELEAAVKAERLMRQRFYAEITEDMKAEFIDGEFVIQSPARNRHCAASENLHILLKTTVHRKTLGIVRHEKVLCVFPRNDYEPDVVFFGSEKAAKLEPETLKFPIPDFVAEVLSDSTEKNDRGVKFEDYQNYGVGEYWIIDPAAETVEQYLIRNGKYQLMLKSGSGEIVSEVVTGFRIPIRAIFDDGECEKALQSLLAN